MNPDRVPDLDDSGDPITPESLCIAKQAHDRVWILTLGKVPDAAERERLHRKWNPRARRDVAIVVNEERPSVAIYEHPGAPEPAAAPAAPPIELIVCRPFTTKLSVIGCTARHRAALLQVRKQQRKGVELIFGAQRCATCTVGLAHARGERPEHWEDGHALERVAPRKVESK